MRPIEQETPENQIESLMAPLRLRVDEVMKSPDFKPGNPKYMAFADMSAIIKLDSYRSRGMKSSRTPTQYTNSDLTTVTRYSNLITSLNILIHERETSVRGYAEEIQQAILLFQMGAKIAHEIMKLRGEQVPVGIEYRDIFESRETLLLFDFEFMNRIRPTICTGRLPL